MRAGLKETRMLKKLLIATTVLGFCGAAMAQDAKAPATTGPAAQSGDNMPKGDSMSKKKTTKSIKMKKTDTK
jgi:hypothetical protein